MDPFCPFSLCSFLNFLVMRQGRGSEATEAVFALGKKASSYRGAYRVPLSVCLCLRVTFVVFIDCESCTRPISTNPVSMEAGEYGLPRGTCFFARRLEVVSVPGMLWI